MIRHQLAQAEKKIDYLIKKLCGYECPSKEIHVGCKKTNIYASKIVCQECWNKFMEDFK